MTLAIAEKLRRKVKIEHREEECSRRWMLRLILMSRSAFHCVETLTRSVLLSMKDAVCRRRR